MKYEITGLGITNSPAKQITALGLTLVGSVGTLLLDTFAVPERFHRMGISVWGLGDNQNYVLLQEHYSLRGSPGSKNAVGIPPGRFFGPRAISPCTVRKGFA